MESTRRKEKMKTKEHITPGNGNRPEKNEQELDVTRKGGPGQYGLENAGQRPMLRWEKAKKDILIYTDLSQKKSYRNVFEQVEIDQDTKNSELNQSQTCHSSAAYGELPFNIAVVLFPELTKLPTTLIFLHMDFKIINNIRFSAFGSQDGWFGLFAVDMKSRRTIRHFYLSHESPITSIKIFQQFNGSDPASEEVNKDNENVSILKKDVNCLVCSAFEPTVVYCNIFKNNGFSVQNQLILPFSTDFDHVNCASVDDFNLDGKTEIILGTFGQRLLYYEWELNNTDSKSGQFM
ncbi:unnamed protein product [Schistosoma margrebowiei]|uniref:Uncharacterized protein n=1 Tax=Schistosoma margrebowiei TaxID=48269 RepID=A0A183LT47_9TREM|nr:unnamed protein product [Schistosoma margrebowiei]